MAGKTLGEVDLRSSCGVAPLALYRAGSVTLNPGGSERLKAGDELIVAGLDEDLERLPSATGNA
jgi:K+/H+ antiporter YhaU regulatory subunit KhtT